MDRELSPQEQSAQRGHEVRDVRVRALVRVATGFLLSVLLAGVFVYWVTSHLESQRRHAYSPASPLASERPLPSGPLLQVSPTSDMRAMRTHEKEILASYGWVDRPKGVVRVPIDRAMALIEKRGVPATAAKESP